MYVPDQAKKLSLRLWSFFYWNFLLLTGYFHASYMLSLYNGVHLHWLMYNIRKDFFQSFTATFQPFTLHSFETYFNIIYSKEWPRKSRNILAMRGLVPNCEYFHTKSRNDRKYTDIRWRNRGNENKMVAAALCEETFWKHEGLDILYALIQLNNNSYKHTLNKLV